MNPPFKAGWADLAGKIRPTSPADPRTLYTPRVDGVMSQDDQLPTSLDVDDYPLLEVDVLLKRRGIR